MIAAHLRQSIASANAIELQQQSAAKLYSTNVVKAALLIRTILVVTNVGWSIDSHVTNLDYEGRIKRQPGEWGSCAYNPSYISGVIAHMSCLGTRV